MTTETQPPADELAALVTQRAALGAENSHLAQLENELKPQLQGHQAALIAGDADAVNAAAGVSLRLQAVASRRAEIAEAAPALDARLRDLHEAVERAATEARALDELRELATSASATLAEMETERARVDAFLSEVAPQLAAHRHALGTQRRQIIGIVSLLAPEAMRAPDVYAPPESPTSLGYIERENHQRALLEKLAQVEAAGVDLSALRHDFNNPNGGRPCDRVRHLEARTFDRALVAIEGREGMVVIEGRTGVVVTK